MQVKVDKKYLIELNSEEAEILRKILNASLLVRDFSDSNIEIRRKEEFAQQLMFRMTN